MRDFNYRLIGSCFQVPTISSLRISFSPHIMWISVATASAAGVPLEEFTNPFFQEFNNSALSAASLSDPLGPDDGGEKVCCVATKMKRSGLIQVLGNATCFCVVWEILSFLCDPFELRLRMWSAGLVVLTSHDLPISRKVMQVGAPMAEVLRWQEDRRAEYGMALNYAHTSSYITAQGRQTWYTFFMTKTHVTDASSRGLSSIADEAVDLDATTLPFGEVVDWGMVD